MASAPVKAAAKERGVRAITQGLVIDLAVAAALVVAAWAPDADIASKTAWVILGTALAKSLLQAVASYVMRLKMAPNEETVLPPRVDGTYSISDV